MDSEKRRKTRMCLQQNVLLQSFDTESQSNYPTHAMLPELNADAMQPNLYIIPPATEHSVNLNQSRSEQRRLGNPVHVRQRPRRERHHGDREPLAEGRAVEREGRREGGDAVRLRDAGQGLHHGQILLVDEHQVQPA